MSSSFRVSILSPTVRFKTPAKPSARSFQILEILESKIRDLLAIAHTSRLNIHPQPTAHCIIHFHHLTEWNWNLLGRCIGYRCIIRGDDSGAHPIREVALVLMESPGWIYLMTVLRDPIREVACVLPDGPGWIYFILGLSNKFTTV